MSDGWLRASGITVRMRRRTVLADVTLSLGPGVVGLLGPNGAGKTTFMRVASTALKPTHGELSLFGTGVWRRGADLGEVRRDIGYAPQTPLAIRHLSAIDQVAYLGWLKGMSVPLARASAAEALDRVGLGDRRNDPVRTLSGGMLRRVGIASALVAKPRIILLDEPTAGLDPAQRITFRQLIEELADRHLVILSTHLVEDVSAICDSVVVLRQGQVVFDGPRLELAARGSADTPGRSALESAFLQLTG